LDNKYFHTVTLLSLDGALSKQHSPRTTQHCCKVRTPLVRLVVDLLYDKTYNKICNYSNKWSSAFTAYDAIAAEQ